MSDYKCKICGGTLNVTEGSTTAVCEYCGNTQTVSKSRDEVIQNLLNRANHLRSICEFDKAQRTYEKVLEYDENDAEAHFGLLLSKYGIEYVKDPATGKYIPTCHRVQYESILTDGDYIAAIENADLSQQPVYTAQVVEISRIQKDILGVVKNEKPFDVFICYKETDANGKRTIDSVIANDIYYELTEAGFKVFFAAITLENKLGQEYEPYIFAALHSAKVMLVVGTKPEYFNAVWVKNEWSRYLKLMKTDRSRTLIPCYRDMDAYDLPDEFSHLQAQDMSKIGFINDVVRGIRKLFTNENDSEVISAAAAPVAPPAGVYSNTVPLLERAFIFLEDGKWDDANEYCEKVLDADPKNARAYLGKLMAELRTRTENNLKNLGEPFDNNSNYSKAIRFGDEKLAAKLKDDNDFIRERNKNLRLSGIYSDAQSIMNGAKTEREYLNAAKKFESIPEFKDSKDLAKECREKAKISCKDSLYASAKAKMNGESIDGYESAIKTFDSIRGWKDANEQIAICQQKIEEIKTEAKRKAEAERIAMKKSAERSKKALAVITIAVCVCVAMAILWTNVLQPMVKYNSAVSLMDNGKYKEAIEAFETMGDYKDSEEKCKEAFQKYYTYAEIGDVITLGSYEQDTDIYNGKEAIEWIVLDKNSSSLLLISKYALDCQRYNSTWKDVSWESSSLREWLNNSFINSAFNAEEQNLIETASFILKEDSASAVNTNSTIEDKIFLLNTNEAEKYFSSDFARQCKPTTYAIVRGVTTDSSNGNCRWWLLSLAPTRYSAATVQVDGSINFNGYFVGNNDYAVRPAMWIDLSNLD